jgi:hypothetical protein
MSSLGVRHLRVRIRACLQAERARHLAAPSYAERTNLAWDSASPAWASCCAPECRERPGVPTMGEWSFEHAVATRAPRADVWAYWSEPAQPRHPGRGRVAQLRVGVRGRRAWRHVHDAADPRHRAGSRAPHGGVPTDGSQRAGGHGTACRGARPARGRRRLWCVRRLVGGARLRGPPWRHRVPPNDGCS